MSPIEHLNPEQKQAASKINGVIRAIAGPGTGKTAMKTARIAYMVSQGVEPESIVALTFTNKASDEMRERIAAQAGENGYKVFAGTYHSFFIQKILKPNQHHDYFKNLGYKDGFFILDDGDSKRLMDQTLKSVPKHSKLVIDALGIDKKGMLSWMSNWRAQGFSSVDVLNNYKKDSELVDAWNKFAYQIKQMADDGYTAEEAETSIKDALKNHPRVLDVFKTRAIWNNYTKACIDTEGVDFDDVLVHAKQLLESDSGLAQRLNRTFQYFSLDEYQDTNQVQHDVIHIITTAGKAPPNIFTVGDTRQSIYGFRKADVRLMSRMDNYYEDIQDVVLSTNYRSTDQLLLATNALAETMAEQLTDGQLKTPEPKTGSKPVIAHFNDDESEASWVADQIQEQLANGEDLSQTAILYRSRSIRSAIEAELLSRDLSYDIIGDTSFWERKEVRDMMSLLRLSIRNSDDLALYRILDSSTLPLTPLTARKKAEREGIRPFFQLEEIAYPKSGRATQKSAIAEPFLNRFKLIKSNLALVDPSIDNFEQLDFALLKAPRERGIEFSLEGNNQDILNKLRSYATDINRQHFGEVVKGLYDDYIWPKTQIADEKAVEKKGGSNEELFDRLQTRKQNVLSVVKIFTDQVNKGLSLQAALDELTLRAEAKPEKTQATVKMMTNHASKGLQFKKTYVIGAECETYWRDENPMPDDYNEEGRNFYVAITRAEQDLAITTSATRFINGETRYHQALPFLEPVSEHSDIQDYRSQYEREAAAGYKSDRHEEYENSVGMNL